MPQEVKRCIIDWFWTVTFSQRYSSSTLTKMKSDATWVRELAQDQITQKLYNIILDVEELKNIRMNQRSVIKNGILCILARNNPKDFDNGDPVTLDRTNASRSNSKENHHFFPYSTYRALSIPKDRINSVLNFAFITRRLNGRILDKKPSVYLREYKTDNPQLEEHLSSHYINLEAYEAAIADNYEGFIDARGKAIINEINSLCRVGTSEPRVQQQQEYEEDEPPSED